MPNRVFSYYNIDTTPAGTEHVLVDDASTTKRVALNTLPMGQHSLLMSTAAAGASTINVGGLATGAPSLGNWVMIDPYTIECEIRRVSSRSASTITLSSVLTYAHSTNDQVVFMDYPKVNILLFGAKVDGSTDDTTAITRALTAAKALGSDHGVMVDAPAGTSIITSQIQLYKMGLRGPHGNAFTLKAAAAFPINTALVRIGQGAGSTFFARLENVSIDCNGVSGSIGVYSNEANESCWLDNVIIKNFYDKGIHYVTPSQNCGGRNLWIINPVTGGSPVGIDWGVGGESYLHAITIASNDEPFVDGIHVNLATSQTHIFDYHMEDCTDGLDVEAGIAVVDEITAGSVTTVTNVVHIRSGAKCEARGIRPGSAANAVVDDNNTQTVIGVGGVPHYNSGSQYPYHLNNVYFGVSGAEIRGIWSGTASLEFSSIAAAASEEQNITVTGALVRDAVIAGPSTTIEAGLVWNAWVSASNVVTVRLTNITAAPIDPGLRNWDALVIGY